MPHQDLFGLNARPAFLEVPEPLDLTSPLISNISSVAEPAQQGNKFRDFVLRVGGGRPSILNFLSGLGGPGTSEIAADKRAKLEQRLFEQTAQRQLAATPERDILKGAGGFQRFVDTGERVFPEAVTPSLKPSSLQEKINLLMGQGIDEKTATGIATGQLVTSRDPVTGEAVILDKATGRPVDDTVQREDIPPITEPSKTGDVTPALGLSGSLSAAVNTIADLFGADLPFQQADAAAAKLNNLNLKTLSFASSGISGRPNVFFQRKIDDLLVKPNTIFQGRAGAINKFRAIKNAFSDEMERIQEDIVNKRFSPKTIGLAKQRVSQLNSLSKEYDAIISQAQLKPLKPLESFFVPGSVP